MGLLLDFFCYEISQAHEFLFIQPQAMFIVVSCCFLYLNRFLTDLNTVSRHCFIALVRMLGFVSLIIDEIIRAVVASNAAVARICALFSSN